MRRLVVCMLLLVLVGAAFPAQARGQSAEGLELAYTLTLRAPDVVDVEVQLRGAPPGETVLGFGPMASFLGAIPDIVPLFSVVSASAPDGSGLAWRWKERDVVVVNGSRPEFTLTYTINGGRLHKAYTPGHNKEFFAIFRPDMLMFAPCDVLPFPRATPSRISLRLNKPEGLQVFSSLREKDGAFEAAPELWGNLLWDFQMAYFIGGRDAKTATHTTEWGDTYLYVSFGEWWDPKLISPQRYLNLVESIAKHFRDTIGPLPPRKVILFGGRWAVGQPEVKCMVDCYHYMQVWPGSSATGQLVHHVFHAYSFFPNKSKMGFSFFQPPGEYLSEGLPMYLELVTTAQLTGETHLPGKLVEFYALNARGAAWGISNSWHHVTYNVPALKVLSLDKHIRAATGGKENLDTFVRNLWDVVKDKTAPAEVSNEDLREAYTRTVGASDTYLFDLGASTDFSKTDIGDLIPAFEAYADKMAVAGFGGNRLLFLLYLDVVAAKGEEWPHYATYPERLPEYVPQALQPFNAYLSGLQRTTFTQDDVVAALNAATGKDHSGFFEFWVSLGIELDPATLGPRAGSWLVWVGVVLGLGLLSVGVWFLQKQYQSRSSRLPKGT